MVTRRKEGFNFCQSSDMPIKKPPTAKRGTATAGLHKMLHPPPEAPRPKDTRAPRAAPMAAMNRGRRSFFRPLLTGALLGLFIPLRPSGPASRGHSGGYAQTGQDHRLQKDPHGQEYEQPDDAHDHLSYVI